VPQIAVVDLPKPLQRLDCALKAEDSGITQREVTLPSANAGLQRVSPSTPILTSILQNVHKVPSNPTSPRRRT
jgi:hypothetical protein